MDENEGYKDYVDIIEELDALPNLPDKSADFIIDLIERQPKILSSKQIQWLDDLRRRYLI